MFVKLIGGADLNLDMENEIRNTIKSMTTSRHIPKYIFSVMEIPYTISGKKVEKAVLSTIIGKEVKNKDALVNPESLFEYMDLAF